MAGRGRGPDAEDVAVLAPGSPHWRWWSWRRLADETAAVEAADGERVPFSWWPSPEALAFDLGVQLAGGIAAPRSPDFVALGLARPEDDAPVGGASPGGCETIAARGGRRGLDPATWRALAEPFATRVAGRPREIAVVAGPLERIEERVWLGACLVAGAAVVLLPTRAFLARDLAWARPTVACLPAAVLPELVSGLRELASPKRVGRRLRRWRRLWVWGDADPSAAAELARLTGVDLAPLPAVASERLAP